MPATYMGRHVVAGHKGRNNTNDFGKLTARPGSAPVAQQNILAVTAKQAQVQFVKVV